MLKLSGDILRGVILVRRSAAAAVQFGAGKIIKILANAGRTNG